MHRLAALVVCLMATGSACAQKWAFMTYNGNQPADLGYVSLEQNGAEATFRMVAPSLDKCWAQPLKAEVIRTETMLVITPVFAFPGCVEQRFHIQLDGKGGYTEFKQRGVWARSNRDRKLTLTP